MEKSKKRDKNREERDKKQETADEKQVGKVSFLDSRILLLFFKLHTHRIDAIANATLVGGAIGKAVPEVSAAGGA